MGKKHTYSKDTLSIEHPAIRAWTQLSVASHFPESVEKLTDSKGRPLNRKSRIFRLRGDAVPGGSIIAKLGPRGTIQTERFVYEDVLPLVGIPHIQSYGCIAEGADQCWIFMQEALGSRYDQDCSRDHTLAARTLAAIHTVTSEMDIAAQLPAHDLERYRPSLEGGAHAILQNIDNPALSGADKKLLNSVLVLFAHITQFWCELGERLSAMPHCLVHGDFVGKNVFIEKSGESPTMHIMDWDIAGWGAPAFDIEHISPALYLKYCGANWPGISLKSIESMIVVGRILRNVGLIKATSSSLCYDWVEDAMRNMSTYESILRQSVDRFQAG